VGFRLANIKLKNRLGFFCSLAIITFKMLGNACKNIRRF